MYTTIAKKVFSLLVYIIMKVIVITIISNGERTDWSTIEEVIGRVISN